MAFRRPIFLFAIAGIAVFSTLFASMSKFIWFQPSGVAYLEGSPIEESKTSNVIYASRGKGDTLP